jgi:hypothetical protein
LHAEGAMLNGHVWISFTRELLWRSPCSTSSNKMQLYFYKRGIQCNLIDRWKTT